MKTHLQVNLEKIRDFASVAQQGGFAQAASHSGRKKSASAYAHSLSDLEAETGLILCHRTPLRPNATGAALLEIALPFLRDLDAKLNQLIARDRPTLRFGGSPVFTQAHLPTILKALAASNHAFDPSIVSGTEEQLHDLLQGGMVQMIIAPTGRPLGPEFKSESLVELELGLLVPPESKYQTAEEILAQETIPEQLILLSGSTTIQSAFLGGLRGLHREWASHSSTALADSASLVALGNRIGLTLMEPHLVNCPGVRALPLLHFPRIKIGVIWHVAVSSLAKHFIAAIRKHTRQVWPLGRSVSSRPPIPE